MQSLTVKSKCPHCGKDHEEVWTLQKVLALLEQNGVNLEKLPDDIKRAMPLYRTAKMFGIRY